MNKSVMSGDSIFILDFLRAIACEMVVIAHIFDLYLTYQGVTLSYKNPLWEFQSFLGMTGVIIFFFISGIVISNSLFRKVTKYDYSFFNYIIDRFSRIYSALIPCLIFIYVSDVVILIINKDLFNSILLDNNSSVTIYSIIPYILMIQNFPFMHSSLLPLAGILWTLNIEWWMYLAFGWVVIEYSNIMKLRPYHLLISLTFIFFPLYRFITGPDNLVMVWLAGIFITLVLYRWDKKYFSVKQFMFLFLVIFIITIARVTLNYIRGVNFYDTTYEILIGFLILIVVLSLNGKKLKLSDKFKQFVNLVAKYSFTLYIIHVAIISLIFVVNISYGYGYPPTIIIPLSFFAANIVAFLIAIFTEMKHKNVSFWIKRAAEGRNYRDIKDGSVAKKPKI